MEEHSTFNRMVSGSSPGCPTKINKLEKPMSQQEYKPTIGNSIDYSKLGSISKEIVTTISIIEAQQEIGVSATHSKIHLDSLLFELEQFRPKRTWFERLFSL